VVTYVFSWPVDVAASSSESHAMYPRPSARILVEEVWRRLADLLPRQVSVEGHVQDGLAEAAAGGHQQVEVGH